MTVRQISERDKLVISNYLKRRNCILIGCSKVGATVFISLRTANATLGENFAEGLKKILGIKQLVVNQYSC